MSETLAFCAFLALVNVAVYVLLRKWDIIDWMTYNEIPKWIIPYHCEFCLFHRLALIEVIAIEIRHGLGWNDWDSILFYPLISAVLSLFFYRRE